MEWSKLDYSGVLRSYPLQMLAVSQIVTTSLYIMHSVGPSFLDAPLHGRRRMAGKEQRRNIIILPVLRIYAFRSC